MVQLVGTLQAAPDRLVGVPTGSGKGVFAGIPEHADSTILIRRMMVIFDIYKPIDFLLNLII